MKQVFSTALSACVGMRRKLTIARVALVSGAAATQAGVQHPGVRLGGVGLARRADGRQREDAASRVALAARARLLRVDEHARRAAPGARGPADAGRVPADGRTAQPGREEWGQVGTGGHNGTRKSLAYRVSCCNHSPHLDIPRSF